ncbi:unnamed protein product [Rhizoctonia solani]|uniref:NACHT domain-containing protein n=1 Tax=Rhizoctonia solani TaxID=456999 RepID=A0A8H3H977_9AGAM|nr:unnamed protein product [Rhizoctonia solani]
MSSSSKRKRGDHSSTGDFLHPGKWQNTPKRSKSPSASGASTGDAGYSHSSPPSNPSFEQSTGSAWTGLESALQALQLTTKICPSLSLAAEDLTSCLPIFEAAAKGHRDHDALATGLKNTVDQLTRHLDEATSESIVDTITDIAEAIWTEIESIKSPQSHSLSGRLLRASTTTEDPIRRYRRIEQLFRRLQAEASMSTWNIIDEARVKQQLSNLRHSSLAGFNSELSTELSRRGCTKDTRTTILEESMAWSDDPDTTKIYWMNGMAGTGKTTIAYSLCERLDARKQLAASFFCTRASPECRDAKRIIPTIAHQFAQRFAPFRYVLGRKLREDPDIATGRLSDQFDLLLKKPLLASKDQLSNNLVIVVDALDECSDPHIVELFLDLLFRSVLELPIKFFVTSRPEPAIRNRMMSGSERLRSILYLHEIEPSLVQADIELYLRDELASIAPADEDIVELAKHAGNLFIYAATAMRYIRPVWTVVDSKARLKSVLAANAKSNTALSAIDVLYMAILTAAIHNEELEPEEQSHIRMVLWTAICACEPIPIRTLALLSGLDDQGNTMAALQPLRSVLHVSDHSGLVTTLHESFRSCMFDQARSRALHCDKVSHSQLLAERCFRIMEDQLRFNICSIRSSFIANDKISELEGQIKNNISDELSYACRFWVDHLSETHHTDYLLLLAYEFLSQRLLFWMEVLSLKNYMVVGVTMLTKLNSWLSQPNLNTPVKLLELASDAQGVASQSSFKLCAFTIFTTVQGPYQCI